MTLVKKEYDRLQLIAKKNELYALIKFIGDYYGEPIESLRGYAKEVVQNNINELDAAIECFRDLKSQCILIKNNPIRTEIKPFRCRINYEADK